MQRVFLEHPEPALQFVERAAVRGEVLSDTPASVAAATSVRRNIEVPGDIRHGPGTPPRRV